MNTAGKSEYSTEKLQAFKEWCAENSGINELLVDAVIEQLGIDTDDEMYRMSDIAQHGIGGGYHGFTYHSDTIEFFQKNRVLIRTLLKDQSEEYGQGMFEMVASFNCLKDLKLDVDQIAECIYTDEETEDRTAILNALSWYAGEEVSREFERYQEDHPESAVENV